MLRKSMKQYLSEHNMTAVKFAEMAGCSFPVIYRVINDHSVTPKIYDKIKKATDGQVIPWIKKTGRPKGEHTKWSSPKLDHDKILEYRIWFRMMEKCYNEQFCEYHNYGAKGITVCKKWLKFDGFFEDLGKIPQGMKSLFLDPLSKEFKKSAAYWTIDARKLRAKRMGIRAFRSERKPKKQKVKQLSFDELGNIS